MYESQLAQLTQQTFNMESAALATENLRNTMATVDAMKQANKELRKQYGKIDIDKIEVCTLTALTKLAALLVSADRPRIACSRCTTTWRTSWNRQTRSRRRLDDRMPFPMRLMKRIYRLVSRVEPVSLPFLTCEIELDALELDVEEEGPSYLSDLNKVPDFIDEPPVEIPEVSSCCSLCGKTSDIFHRHLSRRRLSRQLYRTRSDGLRISTHLYHYMMYWQA